MDKIAVDGEEATCSEEPRIEPLKCMQIWVVRDDFLHDREQTAWPLEPEQRYCGG